MKRFVVSATAAAIAVSAAFTVWPVATTRTLSGRAMAQEPTAPKKETKQKENAAKKVAKRAEEGKIDSASEAVERNLANLGNFQFQDVPLQDLVDSLSEKLAIPIVIDKAALDTAGINPGTTVNMHLMGMRGDKFLDLVLDELNLAWVTRDGYVLITTKTKLLELVEIRVYNCSDLLEKVKKAPQPAGGAEGAFGSSAMAGMSSMPGGGMAGGMAGMGMGMPGMPGMGGMPGAAVPESSAPPLVENSDELIQLIQTTVSPEHWQDAGGQGSIGAYPGGLLVVNQNGQAHRRIENLLNMMRQARRAAPGTVVRER